MILIIDTYGGLCNQMMDIKSIIAFCSKYKLEFSFRNASLRKNNLITWFDIAFYELFDIDFLLGNDLYISYDNISKNINDENTFNYKNNFAINIFEKTNNDQLYIKLVAINKEYIILRQFWALFNWDENFIMENQIFLPNKKIMNIYKEYKNIINLVDNNYNVIHFRYENDFKNYFNIDDSELLLEEIYKKIKFKDEYPIYIATDTTNMYRDNITYINYKFLTKDIFLNEKYPNLNYEEKAFIDFMICLNACEVYGHSKSSFSVTLNTIKNSSNYYNLI
jgi:hypothetical protein